MLNPDLKKLLADRVSRYSLVVAAAKRAREITQECIDNDAPIKEKPVSIATEELLSGKYIVVEPEEIRGL